MERKETDINLMEKYFHYFGYICCEDVITKKFYFVTVITLFNTVNIPQVYTNRESTLNRVHSMSKLILLLYEKLDYKYALQLFRVKYCLYVCISS